MRKDVLEYACNVLDEQLANVFRSSSARKAAEQKAFYDGCKMMFEIIYTRAYTDADKALYVDPYGIHRIHD